MWLNITSHTHTALDLMPMAKHIVRSDGYSGLWLAGCVVRADGWFIGYIFYMCLVWRRPLIEWRCKNSIIFCVHMLAVIVALFEVLLNFGDKRRSSKLVNRKIITYQTTDDIFKTKINCILCPILYISLRATLTFPSARTKQKATRCFFNQWVSARSHESCA